MLDQHLQLAQRPRVLLQQEPLQQVLRRRLPSLAVVVVC
jgi:hypothetical protein